MRAIGTVAVLGLALVLGGCSRDHTQADYDRVAHHYVAKVADCAKVGQYLPNEDLGQASLRQDCVQQVFNSCAEDPVFDDGSGSTGSAVCARVLDTARSIPALRPTPTHT